MATAAPRTVVRAFGRLCKAPTTDPPTDAFPHGGTALGMSAEVIFRPQKAYAEVEAEEYGSEPVEVIEGRESAILGAILRGYDDDAISTIFPNTAVGALSGRRVATYPGTVRSGALGSDRAVAILFSPADVEGTPAIYLPRAVPLVDESARLTYALKREHVVAVLFRAMRDTNGIVYRYGLLEDIAL